MESQLHEGPGLLPGRYAGPPVLLHDGPTPQQLEHASDKARADALAGRLCAAAALAAQSEAELLDLVGEFDASGAVRFWTDVKSVAHWLGWACSMTPGVAREHVRVARALRRMPAVRGAFAEGRLSYSKVRELTRVVDQVDDRQLLGLALTATASQLARTVAGFRVAKGLRMRQEDKRTVSWRTREDGMVELRGLLPAEEGALLVAALEAGRERLRAPEPVGTAAEQLVDSQADTTPVPRNADALVDLARVYLDAVPEDRSGEDRTLVVVHVAAEQLAEEPERAARGVRPGDVPAGTPEDPTCHVEGVGSVEPETARRLACDATVLGAVVDRHGQVLALGRTRRLVSRGQRRALMVRDQGMCQFPGCHQTRHLDAHHRTAWAAGGATDLDNPSCCADGTTPACTRAACGYGPGWMRAASTWCCPRAAWCRPGGTPTSSPTSCGRRSPAPGPSTRRGSPPSTVSTTPTPSWSDRVGRASGSTCTRASRRSSG